MVRPNGRRFMISGVHAIIYSKQAEKLRSFFRDVLGLRAVDAGGGWLIFGLPPAELSFHPTRGAASHELYLMCRDVNAVAKRLRAKGISVARIKDQGWGLLTHIKLPDGSTIGLYEPRHPQPARPKRSRLTTRRRTKARGRDYIQSK